MEGNIYIVITPNKAAVITILYLKLLLYFVVNNNKENKPTANARNEPLETPIEVHVETYTNWAGRLYKTKVIKEVDNQDQSAVG